MSGHREVGPLLLQHSGGGWTRVWVVVSDTGQEGQLYICRLQTLRVYLYHCDPILTGPASSRTTEHWRWRTWGAPGGWTHPSPPPLSPLPCTWNPPIMTLVPLGPQFPQLLAKEYNPETELSLGSEVKQGSILLLPTSPWGLIGQLSTSSLSPHILAPRVS